MATEAAVELPDLFRFEDGTRVRDRADWSRRAAAWREQVISVEYGGLPPAPSATRLEELHTHCPRTLDGTIHSSWRIVAETPAPCSFVLETYRPDGDGPCPILINGDGCWHYVTDEVLQTLLGRGYALALFNRTELAPDVYDTDRSRGLYPFFPDIPFGALSAWAWGYHRVVDALLGLDWVRRDALVAVGHSRGGKTALLAGATDERIALTAPNNSGCGGAGCFRWPGPECETTADLHRNISYWFGPELWQYEGRESEMPFDQHVLKALVAPRFLLTTEAFGDLWANPQGTWQTHRAAQEVFRFLGAEERIAVHYREGGHKHAPEDWRTLLDFADACFSENPLPDAFRRNPFPDLPPAHAWRAPEAAGQ